MVTPTLQAAAWVHPRRLILSDHQQVIMRLGRPEGPWRGTRVSYNLKVATAVTNGSHTLPAPERPLQHLGPDFFSKAESGVVEMAMQGSTRRRRHSTGRPDTKVQRKNTLGPRSQGRSNRERHESCTGACAQLAQPKKEDGQAGTDKNSTRPSGRGGKATRPRS